MEGHLARLGEHEGGVVAWLHPTGVEALLVGGEGVLRVAFVHQQDDVSGDHLQRRGGVAVIIDGDGVIGRDVDGAEVGGGRGARLGVTAGGDQRPHHNGQQHAHQAARCRSRRGRKPIRCTPARSSICPRA